MPFVRIDALRAGQARLDALGRAVHQALIDAIGIPADDLFQVLTSHDGASGAFRYDPGYLGVHRDDGLVFVDITMRSGRTSERKQALYRRIAELASKYAATEPRNIFITIHENDLPDWSFGGGIAQYATGPAPHDTPRPAPDDPAGLKSVSMASTPVVRTGRSSRW